MQHASTIVHAGMEQGQQQERQGISQAVKNLFLMLQGSYGSAFLTKFSTGVKDDHGRDMGIRAAMKVWESRLGKFPSDVLAIAFDRITVECPEFPPSLPQIEKACDAAMPRKTYAEEQGLPALAAPVVKPVHVDVPNRADGKNWARRILGRVALGDKRVSQYAQRSAEMAMGKRDRMT